MAVRYSAEFLLHLRQSPLCVKPPGLPPAEEWMGPPPETFRNQAKAPNDRIKSGDGMLLNNEARRPALDRNGSRSTTSMSLTLPLSNAQSDPDEMILGPPRTSFASATSARNNRTGDADKGFKDPERQDRTDRFNFRSRPTESGDAGDRFGRDGREIRNNGFRRRGDQDQDSDGWSTVKPRKSFGHEGAERFHGRMGGAGGDRFGVRDDRRLRDRDDRDSGDRRSRNFRDQDGDEADTLRRNGLPRGKSDSWFKDSSNGGNNDAPMSQRERIERAKSWRDRDPDDRLGDRQGDRYDRNYERRWDRQPRVENEPEWLDEPAEEKAQGHTEEDFKKFMEAMKAAKGGSAPKPEEKKGIALDKPAVDAVPEVEQKVVSAPPMETSEDKFFATYGHSSLDVSVAAGEGKDAVKPKGGKSSRFMALMTSQEDNRAKTEPATPAAAPQPGDSATTSSQQSETEKVAFARLLQQLQRSAISPQPAAPKFPEPSPFQELQQKSVATPPETFQQYSNDRRDDGRMRTSQPSINDILSPRPVGPPVQPPPVSRPEQALQDLLAQRHQLPNQTTTRLAQNAAAVNSNTEFLMRLMQSHRDAPEPPRTEQLLVRMPQPTKQVSLANIPDREQDYQRERRDSQRQQLRGQGGGPPGFLDDGGNQFHPPDVDTRPPPQPTQILQRPPPPLGLDHQMHPFHMGGVAAAAAAAAAQMPPQRPMIPPPGLMNNSNPPRNINVPMPGMYAPNFPPLHGHGGPGTFAPGPHTAGGGPEGMVGPPHPQGPPGPPQQSGPPRSMQPPPGFFGGPPPPGFMPPPPAPPPGMGGGGGGGSFHQPDGPPNGPPIAGNMGFGLPSPFDRLDRMAGLERRGMMPPGGYRGP
ncbi:hypothetical protein N656DRAFT_715097 [Canariomyces notabilis]|uniref:Uncharacterized protein n=1 Tax=Canariomyces notabilis TaxID=2074819 RepID=A0AAN6QGJ9_9PEZI|nr:hypothetical protein N656DRAFT_715097 [Canariomyces arenarius]